MLSLKSTQNKHVEIHHFTSFQCSNVHFGKALSYVSVLNTELSAWLNSMGTLTFIISGPVPVTTQYVF